MKMSRIRFQKRENDGGQDMKKKLKYLRRQYKRLPKGARTVVFLDILLILFEIICFAITLNIYCLTIAIWVALVISYIIEYEKRMRHKAIFAYRRGRMSGVMLVKQMIDEGRTSDEKSDDTIIIYMN